jgi:hypothetical protein
VPLLAAIASQILFRILKVANACNPPPSIVAVNFLPSDFSSLAYRLSIFSTSPHVCMFQEPLCFAWHCNKNSRGYRNRSNATSTTTQHGISARPPYESRKCMAAPKDGACPSPLLKTRCMCLSLVAATTLHSPHADTRCTSKSGLAPLLSVQPPFFWPFSTKIGPQG